MNRYYCTGFELPQINYRSYNGKPYKYAYGMSQLFTVRLVN